MPKGTPISQLESGEIILWRNSIRKGIWHRHTVEIQEITNRGIVIINEENNPPSMMRIHWSQIDSIVVMNLNNVGTGYHYTVRTGGFGGPANYIGMNTWQGHNQGDVCFLSNGVMVAAFKGISDPTGVKNLALAVKRGSYSHETNYMSAQPLRLT